MTQAVVLKPVDEIRGNLERMQPEFLKVLPAHVTPEKFTRVAMTAIQSNPDLLESPRVALWAELLKCATDGLVIDGREAAMVIFKNKSGEKMPKYMPMVGGILKKIRNSGELVSIATEVVFENDHFDYWVDDNGSHIEHRPFLDGDRGERKRTYAVAKTKDGGTYIEVVSEENMAAVRKVSRARDTGPWAGEFADEMRKKTAIRRLSKRLPMSTDIEKLIREDDELTDFEPSQEKPGPKQDRLMKFIEQSETTKQEDVEIGNPFETPSKDKA